ncbi:MAG: hypothetical protein LBK72_00545, partial [Bifidobacteriaceae bacterium]|nr:hypothetical protein [Bifidobacteriaceae bacterium]
MSPPRHVSRTMPALTMAVALALGGGLAVGTAPAAAEAQAIPDGVYRVEELRVAGAEHGVSPGMALAFDLTQGEARIAAGCLPYGHATYQARWDGGTWSFAVGDLSTKGCPGDRATRTANVIAALSAGTAWHLEATHLGYAPAYVVTGPAMEVILVPAASTGETQDTARYGPPDDPALVPALQGTWRVDSIVRTGTSGAEWLGPFEWSVTFDATRLTMPRGCNTPASEVYLATPSGAFFMRTGEAYTMIGCHGESNESEELFWALAGVRWWSEPAAGTLILTGTHVQVTLVRSDPVSAAPSPSVQGIPNGVYEIGSWNVPGGSSEEPSSRLRLSLVDGVARWAGGCLPTGAFFYSASPDGRWRVTADIRSTGECPGEAASAASLAVERLTRASAWSAGSQSDSAGTYHLSAGSSGSLTLHHLPHLAVPEAAPVGDPETIPAMGGTWRVAAIVQAPSTGRAGSGPYAWTFTIDPARIALPLGCTTGAGEAYVATATGAFAMRSPAIFAAMACSGERDESDNLFHALANATRWTAPTPDTLVFTGQDTEVRLERAAATNMAFAVQAIRPAVKTVRLAVGQAAKLAITANPLAPRATGKATVRWSNSRGAIARVAVGAKKATKTGSIAVPMNTGTVANLTITGAKKGTSRLTLTAPSGVKTEVKVIVVTKRVKPTTVTITGAVGAWTTDGTMALSAVVRPAKATGALPQWSS